MKLALIISGYCPPSVGAGNANTVIVLSNLGGGSMRLSSVAQRTTVGLMAVCAALAVFVMDSQNCNAQIAFTVNIQQNPEPFSDGFAYWYGIGRGNRGLYRVEMRVDLTKKTIIPMIGIQLTDVKFVVRRGNEGKEIFSQANLNGFVLAGPAGPQKTMVLRQPTNPLNQGYVVMMGSVTELYVNPDPAKSGPGQVSGFAYIPE
jgi:hypothetical protein